MLTRKKIEKFAPSLTLLLSLAILASCSPRPPRYLGRPSPAAGPGNAVSENGNKNDPKGSNGKGSGNQSGQKPGPDQGGQKPGPENPGPSDPPKPGPGPTDPKPDPETPPPAQDPNAAAKVEVKGRQLFVNDKAFIMRSIAWNPVRKGQNHPEGLSYRNPSEQDLRDIDRDLQMIKDMGGNTIRTYDVVRDQKVLDLIKKHKLFVIVPALNYFGTTLDTVKANVEALKNHPTTLMWELGNEWNYNALYGNQGGANGAKEQIKAAAKLIDGLDRAHPISSTYGEIPPKALVDEMGDIDIWGTNVYSGLSFGDRFQRWKGLSGKPLYVGEYGADAINKTAPDVNAQAQAVTTLSREILNNLSARDPNNALIGGSVFEFSDEWWKDGGGSLANQEIGGIAPGGGPHPDAVFNEEWWGLVDIDRKPRPAYTELKAIWSVIKD